MLWAELAASQTEDHEKLIRELAAEVKQDNITSKAKCREWLALRGF